ncbi:MAG: HAD family hydrolase [Deltaproteobacteria bacterium]|nr:HAD family hydrolase [Deltaproteobacteria bacterium]
MSVLVAFDLDGTLVDSVADIAAALNAALCVADAADAARAECDRAPLAVDVVRRMVGGGARNLCLQASVAAGLATDNDAVDALLARFRAHYERDLAVHTRPFDGVVGALDALLAAGVVLGVATNKPGVFARPLMQALLPGRCAAVLGPDDVLGLLKPDPAMLFALPARAGVPDVVVACHVGDSAVDVDCARAAGVPVVGVTWGLRPDEVRAADVVVDRPADLAAAVLGLLSPPRAAHRR